MKYLTLAKSLIEQNEGRRNTVYKDSLGINTVGVGRNLEGKGLSNDEIDYLLANDIKEVVQDLETMPWFAGLTDGRKAVMIDMRFQLGPSRFRGFKRMIEAVRTGRYSDAAAEIKNSVLADQAPNRAKRNISIMLSGEMQ